MKEKWTGKRLFYLMLLIIVFSLCLTAIIVTGLIDDADGKEAKYWFFEESIQTGKDVELKNVYIINNDNGKIHFLCDNITYTVDGRLEEAYVGVADIVIHGDKISKIRIKPNTTNGTLYSYDEETVQVMSEEVVSLSKNVGLPVYKVSEVGVQQSNWNDMIIGTSSVRCIMERGQVCSIIIEESLPSEIRVIIKNGNSIHYPNLYIMKKSDGTFIDVEKEMIEQDINEIVYSDSEGMYLCNQAGHKNGEYYEGEFRVIKEADGMVLINTLPIETYVKYVLPSEMPKSFHEEALKAQAVCARTFAYAHMKNQSYARYGANLDDSTAFQVYHAAGRFAETDAAVDATSGEIIMCNGQLITCYYFSTSAGKTNNMSVWGSKTPEYIGICESQDTNSPFYKWKAYIDKSDIQELRIVSKNESNYVTGLEIKYKDKTEVLKNENDIRKALGKYLQETVLNDGKIRTDLSMIPSAAFQVLETKDNQIILEGGGFGHGIGMSQYGANKMAEEGIGYKDIIEHYFNSIVVKSV